MLDSSSINVTGSVDNQTVKENIDFTDADFEGSISVNTKLLTAEGRKEIADAYKNLPENLEKTGKNIADATGKGYELLPEGIARDTVEIANHLIADIVPLPTNNGGLVTKLANIGTGEVGFYLDENGNRYSAEDVRNSPVLANNITLVFVNGILNPVNLAFNNAREQTGQNDPTLIHIPTHGTVPDGIEVIWNKYLGNKYPTGNARQAGEILDIINDNNYGQNIASHSGGGTIVAPWLAQQPQGSLVGSNIGFSGVPLGRKYLRSLGLSATGNNATVNINSGDTVGNILGRNARGMEIPKSIIMAPLLMTPFSTHSNYPCSVCN